MISSDGVPITDCRSLLEEKEIQMLKELKLIYEENGKLWLNDQFSSKYKNIDLQILEPKVITDYSNYDSEVYLASRNCPDGKIVLKVISGYFSIYNNVEVDIKITTLENIKRITERPNIYFRGLLLKGSDCLASYGITYGSVLIIPETTYTPNL